jgi:hypothetical protein
LQLLSLLNYVGRQSVIAMVCHPTKGEVWGKCLCTFEVLWLCLSNYHKTKAGHSHRKDKKFYWQLYCNHVNLTKMCREDAIFSYWCYTMYCFLYGQAIFKILWESSQCLDLCGVKPWSVVTMTTLSWRGLADSVSHCL